MIEWIHFESARRFHAVYTTWGTSYATYCGMFRTQEGLRGDVDGVTITTAPPARCRCCVGRMERPYLMPDKLRKLKTEAA